MHTLPLISVLWFLLQFSLYEQASDSVWWRNQQTMPGRQLGIQNLAQNPGLVKAWCQTQRYPFHWCLWAIPAQEEGSPVAQHCSLREEKMLTTSPQMCRKTFPSWCALSIEKPIVCDETGMQHLYPSCLDGLPAVLNCSYILNVSVWNESWQYTVSLSLFQPVPCNRSIILHLIAFSYVLFTWNPNVTGWMLPENQDSLQCGFYACFYSAHCVSPSQSVWCSPLKLSKESLPEGFYRVRTYYW